MKQSITNLHTWSVHHTLSCQCVPLQFEGSTVYYPLDLQLQQHQKTHNFVFRLYTSYHQCKTQNKYCGTRESIFGASDDVKEVWRLAIHMFDKLCLSNMRKASRFAKLEYRNPILTAGSTFEYMAVKANPTSARPGHALPAIIQLTCTVSHVTYCSYPCRSHWPGEVPDSGSSEISEWCWCLSPAALLPPLPCC